MSDKKLCGPLFTKVNVVIFTKRKGEFFLKKIISWASALELVSSSFAALPLSANAEVKDVLFSNSFKGYESHNTVTYDRYNGYDIGNVMLHNGGQTMKIDGMTLATCERLEDDTSYWKASVAEENTYLTTTVARFSNSVRGAKLTFDETYAPSAGEAVVVSFKFMVTPAASNTQAPAFKLGNTLINAADFAGEDGEVYNTWYEAKVVVTSSESSIYNGTQYLKGSTDTSVSGFSFIAYKADGSEYGEANETGETPYDDYMTVSIDDLVVFTSDSVHPETDQVPAAEDPTGEVVTPSPAPTNAPKTTVTVPSNATEVKSANFDSQDLTERVRVYPATPAMSFVDGDFTVSAGTFSPTRSGTYGEVLDYTYGENKEFSTNILEMYDGGHASAARGPKVELTDNVSTADLTEAGESYHMTFQVKLDDGAAGPASLYFVDTKGDNRDDPGVYSYLGTDYQYKYVLATITTGTEDLPNGIINVPAGEFVVVDFYIYADGSYGININDEWKYEHTGEVHYGISSDYKITPSQLPALVINTTKDVTTNTKATIDDIYAYKLVGEADVTTYDKYTATYDDNGILSGLTIEKNVDPSTVGATENTATLKTFVWSNKMVPYTAE